MDWPTALKRIAITVAAVTPILAEGAAFAQNQNRNQRPAAAPNGAPQNQQAAPPGAKPQHALEGRWFVTWVGRSSASQMVISQIQTMRGVTTFSGQIAAPLGDETCPLTGSVVDNTQVSYSDGFEQRNVPLPAVVFMRGQCRNQIILLELLGMPGGKILMNGRAALISQNGNRAYEPVALSRP